MPAEDEVKKWKLSFSHVMKSESKFHSPKQIKWIFDSDELIFHIVKSQKVSFAHVPFNVFAHYCSVDKDRC